MIESNIAVTRTILQVVAFVYAVATKPTAELVVSNMDVADHEVET